jgi:hypothetical protein
VAGECVGAFWKNADAHSTNRGAFARRAGDRGLAEHRGGLPYGTTGTGHSLAFLAWALTFDPRQHPLASDSLLNPRFGEGAMFTNRRLPTTIGEAPYALSFRQAKTHFGYQRLI